MLKMIDKPRWRWPLNSFHYLASHISDELEHYSSRGFRPAALSAFSTTEIEHCNVEILLCSAEQALAKNL